MKKILLGAIAVGALLVPAQAPATHSGCFATPATGECEYVAAEPHQAIVASWASWEIYSFRNDVKHVFAQGAALDPAGGGLVDVGANAGETVYVVVNQVAPGAVRGGFISSGNNSGEATDHDASIP